MEKHAIKSCLEGIISGLNAGRFSTEARVSNGIILNLLGNLGWDVVNIDEVTPEYSVGDGRVDFALCNKPGKPFVFIEVKAVDNISDAGVEQLFRYAFRQGAPILILTDGKEWHFYLLTGQGSFSDRRFSKLDLLQRDLDDCVEIFYTFLHRDSINSGRAQQDATNSIESEVTKREIESALPEAWKEVFAKANNSALADELKEKVASICGHTPSEKNIKDFLDGEFRKIEDHIFGRQTHQTHSIGTSSPKRYVTERKELSHRQKQGKSAKIPDILYRGEAYNVRYNITALEKTLILLQQEDKRFLARFAAVASQKQRTRQLISKDINTLYQDKSLLKHGYSPLPGGWYLGRVLSAKDIKGWIKDALKEAGKRPQEFGVDFSMWLAK